MPNSLIIFLSLLISSLSFFILLESAFSQLNDTKSIIDIIEHPLIGTPLRIINETEILDINNTTVINATNPILGNIRVIDSTVRPHEISVCSDYKVRPIPSLKIVSATPQFPLKTHFVENRPFYIVFELKNNANVPISGQLYGGKAPYSIDNLEPGMKIIQTIEALAPFAGWQKAFYLFFYDNCAFDEEGFREATTIAEIKMDTYSRYWITLNSFYSDEARSLSEDTILVGASAQTGDQEFEKGLFIGDVGDHTTKDVNIRLGPFDIIPNDLSFLSFEYIVTNAGWASNLDTKATATVANAATIIASAAYPPGAIGFLTVNQLLQSIFLANCDGTVAADKIRIPSFDLDDSTKPFYGFQPGKSYSKTIFYPGTKSPPGCGSDSRYYVTWTIERDHTG